MILKNKLAIVTGASKGIGYHTALQLLEKGAMVAGWSRTDPQIEHPNFLHSHVDIKSTADVDAAYEAARTKFGKEADVLINNAGYGFFKYLEDYTPQEWQDMFAVNVFGLYYATRKVLPAMKAQRSGHIINIASIVGKEGVPQASAYSGTKFAVRGISQSLYKEVKEFNIKVTCVMPGSVNTHFFDHTDLVKSNPTMLHPDDLARLLIQQLESPDNFNVSEIEVRPMNVKYT